MKRIVNTWVLYHKSKKKPAYFSADCYESDKITVYEFHVPVHTLSSSYLMGVSNNRGKGGIWRYKDTFQIDRLRGNNGWDTKCNLVSTWECRERILGEVKFKKDFTPCPHVIVYDFELTLSFFMEYLTDVLTFLSKHISISVANYVTFSKGLVYLVN